MAIPLLSCPVLFLRLPGTLVDGLREDCFFIITKLSSEDDVESCVQPAAVSLSPLLKSTAMHCSTVSLNCMCFFPLLGECDPLESVELKALGTQDVSASLGTFAPYADVERDSRGRS